MVEKTDIAPVEDCTALVPVVKNAFHNDSLQLFNDTTFIGILTKDDVVSRKKAISVDKEKYYGYFLEKNKTMYFIEDLEDPNTSILDQLPIRVTKKFETDYNKTVFFMIEGYQSVKIPIELKLSFKNLIDSMANYKHTNPLHWTLYKIVKMVGKLDRINARVITELGFGKDSIINNVSDLVGGVANIYGATYAKLEYSLKDDDLVFNEMGGLKGDDKANMQIFLLATGAFANKYLKRSRAMDDTQEEYDISKTSLTIVYNPPKYYVTKGQEYFDQMFTPAVMSRFIPFFFTGKLDEEFDSEFDVQAVVDASDGLYKDMISTILYYRSVPVMMTLKLPSVVKFNHKQRRFQRTFMKIADYVAEYCGLDQELFDKMITELFKCYKQYERVRQEAELLLTGD